MEHAMARVSRMNAHAKRDAIEAAVHAQLGLGHCLTVAMIKAREARPHIDMAETMYRPLALGQQR